MKKLDTDKKVALKLINQYINFLLDMPMVIKD
jgi:hypothetical protein